MSLSSFAALSRNAPLLIYKTVSSGYFAVYHFLSKAKVSQLFGNQ